MLIDFDSNLLLEKGRGDIARGCELKLNGDNDRLLGGGCNVKEGASCVELIGIILDLDASFNAQYIASTAPANIVTADVQQTMKDQPSLRCNLEFQFGIML